jgi:hypothetical protein
MVIDFSDGRSKRIANAITINAGGQPRLWADLIMPRFMRVGSKQPLTVVFGNSGDIDAADVIFWVSVPESVTISAGVPYLDEFTSQLQDPPVPVDGNIYLWFYADRIAAGEVRSIPLSLTSPTVGQLMVRAYIFEGASILQSPAFGQSAVNKSNALLRSIQYLGRGQLSSSGNSHCQPGDMVFKISDPNEKLLRTGHVGICVEDDHVVDMVPGSPIPMAGSYRRRTLENWAIKNGTYLGSASPPDLSDSQRQKAVFEANQLFNDHIGQTIPFFVPPVFGTDDCVSAVTKIYRRAGYNPSWLDQSSPSRPFEVSMPGLSWPEAPVAWRFLNLFTAKVVEAGVSKFLLHPVIVSGTILVQVVTAIDPNEKVGSLGKGAPRFLSNQEPLRYAIDFENKAAATAPAQRVVINDQLDPANVDLLAVSLEPISFGDQQIIPMAGISPEAGIREFNETIDLRPANNLLVRINARLNTTNGLLTWTFDSLDPATGLPTPDALAGFLPPGAGGSVFFTVSPKPDLTTGTVINNSASIIFDSNAAIVTPTWSNTIDNSKPTSHVLALPATQNSATFNVQWSGADTGSGIGDYTIYVSDNGGPFTPWLTQTTATQATFTSTANHTYSFFSQAHDLTGNTEALKATAEATTRIVAVANIASKVTDHYGNGVNDVKMTLSGDRSVTAQTDESGASSFSNLPTGSYTVTPSKTNYTFTPQNKTFGSQSTNQTADFIARVSSGAPILISEETTTRAIALDSVLWLREPFRLDSPVPWRPDRRTRVMLFAMNLDLLDGEDFSVVTADAEDGSHRAYPMTVEYVGRIPGRYWLNCVVVRLNDNMGDVGDVLVRITARSVPSNRVRLGVGHVGGGPSDDLGSVPTPGREP